MRRETNISKYIIISILIIALAIISLISFLISRGVRNANEKQFAGELSELSDELNKSDTASSSIGKNIEESEQELSEIEEDDNYEESKIVIEENEKLNNKKENIEETKTSKKDLKPNSLNEVKQNKKNEKKDLENKTTIETNSKVKKEEEKEEKKKKEENEEKIEMEAPVKGEVLREFAKDSLVFSNTLQEWITHNGIDIKADKTSVVKAAAKGTVSAIKNDPRYGLTVIISHDNGDKTIYSNLLTAEFVVKGEKVEKGQTIGTIGNSASFEVEDEYHLHFELIKNDEYVDPAIYINFE